MKKSMVFLILVLILAIGMFFTACSTNSTPDVPNTTNEDTNKNGIVDYNNENGSAADDTTTTDDGINNNSNQ